MSRAKLFIKCLVDDCERNAHWSGNGGQGLCNAHLYRLKRHGHPLGGRISPGEAERYLRETIFTFEGDECLAWPYAKNSAGYGHLHIEGKDQLVHRLACEHAHGPAPTPIHVALHSCGKGHLACCNKRHLRWGTKMDNAADMIAHGNSQRGERHYAAKLTSDDVRFIRQSRLDNVTRANRFGVERSNILAVRKMKSWRHIQ